MTQVNQFLQDLSKHSDAVKKCTASLHHLGVTCFYYAFIRDNGDHVLLTDSPETVEYYYDNNLYHNDPYMRHPDNYKSGFFIIENFKKNAFDKSLAYVGQKFKTSPIIGVCEKQEGCVEFFRFWGQSGESNFDSLDVQYVNLLKEFTRYFKQECGQITKHSIGPSSSLPELIGSHLFKSIKTPSSKINLRAIQNYLKEIGLRDYVIKADLLSVREKSCIALLLKSKSTKEIAAELMLSPRTVEHYLENVKNKFQCKFKNELFSIAERLYELGLIDADLGPHL